LKQGEKGFDPGVRDQIPEVNNMPVYEFECKNCKQIFEVVMTMAEAALEKMVCPICNCEDVQQQFSPFAAVTAKKS